MKRVFLIVLDSLGIGNAPDAKAFGDEGANTLKRISASPDFSAKNLISLGLSDINVVDYLASPATPVGTRLSLREMSQGKDTTTGHWELMGIVSENPMPTYPNGFPEEIISEFSKRIGMPVLCNKVYSGTDVIRDYGKRHLNGEGIIVYTSADSVFQIAAHEDIIPPKKLYEYCKTAREILVGEHAVGRVIARPFITKDGVFVRTSNRRDFSVMPPSPTALDKIKNAGLETVAVGKITDIFAGKGITRTILSHSNEEGMELTKDLLSENFGGLVFTNLVDFDMLFGHRQDTDGYAKALSRFDAWLGTFMSDMRADDILMITADHGCDPGDDSTDHTRELVPLLIYGNSVAKKNLGTHSGFGIVGDVILHYLGIESDKITDKEVINEIFS